MEELLFQEMKANELEQAIIKWDVSSIKKILTNQRALIRLGYSLNEINKMHLHFFGIKIPNEGQRSPFENAVYNDVERISKVHIQVNPKISLNQTDYYEIANRLSDFQGNKNRMQEKFFIKYLQEASDLERKNKVLEELLKIYKEEEYLPERWNDIKRLLDSYPEVLKYSQLARSLQIELLYRDRSDEGRYKKICDLGYSYEKKPENYSQKAKFSKLPSEEATKTYSLEDKAKYLYAISLAKCNEVAAWDYFKDNKLYEITNVTYMWEFLDASKLLLKLLLPDPSKKDYYSPILHAMADKAKSEKTAANYGFLLYLNREFGDEFGISKQELEELYKKAVLDTAVPFGCNGYGTYLYALAQEYIRENDTLDGFTYKEEFLRLKQEFYSYFNNRIEENVLDVYVSNEDIRNRISNINYCISTGEWKLLDKEGILYFFQKQESEISMKYDNDLVNILEEAKKANISRYMLQYLNLSKLSDLSQDLSNYAKSHELDENIKKKFEELRFYLWKKILYNFDNSKDQWLILAKIYEYYMKDFKRLEDKERNSELKKEYKENRNKFLNKIANALRTRAELNFVYDDWYDLYQFYFKQAEEAENQDEKADLIKSAYEVYLEMAEKTHNDPDQAGKHFVSLSAYFQQNGENMFKLCIIREKDIAKEYIEELAKLYKDYRQYRYHKLAFEIAKVSGEYEKYLTEFGEVLAQLEIIQLVRNILYLLQIGECNTAQKFYSYCRKHVNGVPKILELTNEIIEGLSTNPALYQNVLNLLKIYPNVQSTYTIVFGTDKDAMLNQIKALDKILKFFESGMEYTGELECSSIHYAKYLQYQQLYLIENDKNYLKDMFDSLEFSSRGKENLSYKYKLITLCYRYDELNKDPSSLIENMLLSPEYADKIKEYQFQLESLKNRYLDQNRKFFYELCDLSLFYSPKNSIIDIKNFIKNHILSDEIEMSEALRDYLMSFDIIGKAWLQLYFEESGKISGAINRSFHYYTNGFESVSHVIRILENSTLSNKSLVNIEKLKECVYNSDDMNPYISLVEEFLREDGAYPYDGLELLHHFFSIMAKDEKLSLYRVVDTINNNSNYENKQCIDLLEQLYKRIKDNSNLKYLTSLARQYAKARKFIEAKKCYEELLEQASNNTNLAKQYEYVIPQLLAMTILVSASKNEKIKISEMEGVKGDQIYKVLTYLLSKYPDEITKVMELMDEEERNLLHYIKQLMEFEKQKRDMYKNNAEVSMDSSDEITEEKLFESLLLLKDSRHFSKLLPNLYQASNNIEFKHFLSSYKDNKIQSILKEYNNKEILVLTGQRMKNGQKLMLIDDKIQAMNVYVDKNEGQDIIKKKIDEYRLKKDTNEISNPEEQLKREQSYERRKNILLQILASKSYNPDHMENNTQKQKQLNLWMAELGYLLHLEEFEKNIMKIV